MSTTRSWSTKDNKTFERALAIYNKDTLDRWNYREDTQGFIQWFSMHTRGVYIEDKRIA